MTSKSCNLNAAYFLVSKKQLFLVDGSIYIFKLCSKNSFSSLWPYSGARGHMIFLKTVYSCDG